MELKPMYETGTVSLDVSSPQVKKLVTKVVPDPEGAIPNGIYKVINWEKARQTFSLLIALLVAIASSIVITLYATVYHPSWVGYIVPIAFLTLSLYKAMLTTFEKGWLKKSVARYREDIAVGLSMSTPPFISKLYIELHKKQVAHNWITFSLIFYGGISTLLLWWLKDFSWWIFDVKSWVSALFANPDLMTIIFAITLVAIAFIHIVMLIQRKKRLLDIDAYFGEKMATQGEVEVIKQSRNKMYRRMFVISLMVILVIPLLVVLIVRLWRKK